MHRIIALPLTAVVLAAGSFASPFSVPASAAGMARSGGACDSHLTRATPASTSQVIVYRTRTHRGDSQGSPIFDVWACLRPRGGSSLVTTFAPPLGEYGSARQIGRTVVVGTVVAVYLTTGGPAAAACGKYEQGDPSCPTPTTHVFVRDLAHHVSCETADLPVAQLESAMAASPPVCSAIATPVPAPAPAPAG
jgi:hypothetical protein